MADLRFPIRDPGDELGADFGEVVSEAVANGQLSQDEVPVIREIRRRFVIEEGVQTFGEALERLEGLGDPGRRQWLDAARVACGMESITAIEQRRADLVFEGALARTWPPPPPQWSEMQRCPECGAYPTKAGGAWTPVTVEKWWCDEHKHLAEEGDLEEHQEPYIGFNGSGAPIMSEREAARVRKWHEEREAEEARADELREEHARQEGEALDRVQERYDREAWVSVAGQRVHPRDITVS
ncbi:MAG: hypothetical protein WB462_07615 [Solirubrobacterales bacterium]